jgi:hypothetical protein
MATYRIGVHDDPAGGVTLWYDQDSAITAYTTYRLLRRYVREGVGVCLQARDVDGDWHTITAAAAAAAASLADE